MVFIAAAEAHAMGAVLPGHVVDDVVAAHVAALRGVGGIAEFHIGADDGHFREADAEAAGALFFGGVEVAVAPVLVGEAEVVDEGGGEGGGDAQDGLVGLVAVDEPVGGEGVAGAGAEAAVAVVGVAGEEVVIGVDAVIELGGDLAAIVGIGVVAGEAGEVGGVGLDGDDGVLVVVFDVEEEQFVLLDGAGEEGAGLAAGEEGVGGEGVAAEGGVGGEVVVAEEEVGAAVEVVAAGAGDDVDGSAGGDAGGEVEVGGGDLELFDDFLGEVLGGAAFEGVADVAAIDGEGGFAGGAAEDGDGELGVVLGEALGADGDAGFEEG